MSKKKPFWMTREKGLDESFSTVRLEVFGYEVRVILTESIQRSYEKLQKLRDRPITNVAQYTGLCINSFENHSYILLPYEPRTSLLAHEVSHAVWNLFQFIGATAENEIQAYCMGYIAGYIANEIDNEENARKAKAA